VDDEEKKKYASKLDKVPGANLEEQYLKVGGHPKSILPNTDWSAQVRWTRVPDLVEKRRVFLEDGWAYVPNRELSSIVFQEFQTRLERALEVVFLSLCWGIDTESP
jgi:DNA primase large subunit